MPEPAKISSALEPEAFTIAVAVVGGFVLGFLVCRWVRIALWVPITRGVRITP